LTRHTYSFLYAYVVRFYVFAAVCCSLERLSSDYQKCNKIVNGKYRNKLEELYNLRLVDLSRLRCHIVRLSRVKEEEKNMITVRYVRCMYVPLTIQFDATFTSLLGLFR